MLILLAFVVLFVCFFRSFFFFNDTATTEIYTLSLHDALPIFLLLSQRDRLPVPGLPFTSLIPGFQQQDRKSTRLNSSHGYISYAVFCLKKKKTMRCWRDCCQRNPNTAQRR